MKKIVILAAATCLTACVSNMNRYQLAHDKTPEQIPQLDHIENALPRYEPYSVAGNKNYILNGTQYEIIQDPETFEEKGIASWYGEKFHGHLTSNGEIYDMYSMSAAHKTLPLPSYVEVINTQNNKVAIVRVNDRGPFHEGRIIDLSYAAAHQLGVLETGVAKVKIRLLKVKKPTDDFEWQARAKQLYFVQLIATSDQKKAQEQAKKYTNALSLPTHILEYKGMYRIRLGPFYDNKTTLNAQKKAHDYQINGAFITIESSDTEPSAQ